MMWSDFAKFLFVADADFNVFRKIRVEEEGKCFFNIGTDLLSIADEDAVFAGFEKAVWFEVVFLMCFEMIILGLVFTVGVEGGRVAVV